MSETIFLSAPTEHKFWLGILQDHARFLIQRLSSQEEEWREAALRYALEFETLRSKLDTLPKPGQAAAPLWIAFAKEAHATAAGYYKLEGQLQAKLLGQQGGFALKEALPFSLNSTLNENQEYLRLLAYYVQGAEAPTLPLWSLMELWLEDQVNHAKVLGEWLDQDEPPAAETGELAGQFSSLLLQNKAIHGFLRFTPSNFPYQLKHAREAAATAVRFFRLLEKTRISMLQSLNKNQTALSMLDHFLQEGLYFMEKLFIWIPDARGLMPLCRSNRAAAN